jgi:hypothetical protein
MTSIMNLLQRYSGTTPQNAPASVQEDFTQVSQGAQTDHLAGGLSDAFRSDQTPPFENMVASLFGASNGEQKAGILNQLLTAVGPSVLASPSLGSLSPIIPIIGSQLAVFPGRLSPSPAADVLSLVRVNLNEPVKKRSPFVDRLYVDSLIQSVNIPSVRILEQTGDTVSRYPHCIEKTCVRSSRLKRGDNRNAGPHLICHFLDWLQNLRRQRCGGRDRLSTSWSGDRNRGIIDDLYQLS